MTFLYPQRPQTEAAQDPYGQVSQEQLASLPEPNSPTRPNPGPSGEIVRHIIIGSHEAVRETIHRLHVKRYVEQAMWTGPVKIGPSGVIIPHEDGQILYYLMRLRSLEVPKE